MSGRVYGSTEAQARQALALARGGPGPKRDDSVWALAEGLEAGVAAKERAGREEGGEGSCVVDLSRPPFPCSSDGLDLYTCRQAMRWVGADKLAAKSSAAWKRGARGEADSKDGPA